MLAQRGLPIQFSRTPLRKAYAGSARFVDLDLGLGPCLGSAIQLLPASAAKVCRQRTGNAKPWEPKFVIRNFDLAIGVKQGEPRLVAKLNEWVTPNLKNGKLSAIYKQYYGVALPAAMTN